MTYTTWDIGGNIWCLCYISKSLFIDRFPEIVKVREENDCTTKVNNDTIEYETLIVY